MGTARGPGFFAAVISSVLTNVKRSSVLSPTSTPPFPGTTDDGSELTTGPVVNSWTTVIEHQTDGPNIDLPSTSYNLQWLS